MWSDEGNTSPRSSYGIPKESIQRVYMNFLHPVFHQTTQLWKAVKYGESCEIWSYLRNQVKTQNLFCWRETEKSFIFTLMTMARTANVSPPSLLAVSATQMLPTRTPSARLMRGGNQDEGMEEKDEEDEDEKKDDDVCRCLASCRCKFCPESSNSGLGQGRDDKVAVESCLAVPQPILNGHCVSSLGFSV